MPIRVCVIGGGPSGLAQLRAFQSVTDTDIEVVCLEKQSDYGGLWNFSLATGKDEFGEPVHGSMYKYLWSNGPKEGLEFADYTFEEHFGKAIPSYPPRPVLWNYIKGRIENGGLKKWIKVNSYVRNVSFNKETDKFTVQYVNTVSKESITEVFDYVIVATGHFSFPNEPPELLEKLQKFSGTVEHAHNFRDACKYTGRDVLVIGSSYSAEDIGSQCYKYGCKSVTVSWRSKPLGYQWPTTWKEVPLLTHAEGNTVYFKDGSSAHVDDIILCTGYKHHFPFLSEDLKLNTDNRLWPLKLYKGVVWEDNTKLFYLGMQDQYYTFNMFDAQAWLVRDFILKRVAVPSLEAMQEDNALWRKREERLENPHDQIVFQGDYVKDIMSLTDYPPFDVDKVNEVFFEWKHHKEIDIMGYRNYPFKSVMTGTMSPIHHTTWLQALDDSLETYLSTGN